MNIRERMSCQNIIRAAARASGTGFFSIEKTAVLPLSAAAMEKMVMGLSRVFDPAGLITRDAAMNIAVSVLKRELHTNSGRYSGRRFSNIVTCALPPAFLVVWPLLRLWDAAADRRAIETAGWDIAREFARRAAKAKATARTACFE